MPSFNEGRFQHNMKKAVAVVKTLLENNRNPMAAGDVNHAYGDKYLLANCSTNTACAAAFNVLETMGLDSKQLDQLKDWAKTRSVTLTFGASHTTKFLREVKRDVESATKHVTSVNVGGREVASSTHKTVTTITEYFWQFNTEWSLYAYRGNTPDDRVVLQGGKGQVELKTTTKVSPQPESSIIPSQNVNITWLLQQLDDDNVCRFVIDRSDPKKCLTPRRNPDIEAALRWFRDISSWAVEISLYFVDNIFAIEQECSVQKSACNIDDSIFFPNVPLFEEGYDGGADNKGQNVDAKSLAKLATDDDMKGRPVLSINDLQLFLAEHQRTMRVQMEKVDKVFPSNGKLVTAQHGKMVSAVGVLEVLNETYFMAIQYIEEMLRRQIIAAVGKIVQPHDFAEYMEFHNRRLFKPEFKPVGFCYAIRRPDHYPEGTLSIEQSSNNGDIAQPIKTVARYLDGDNAPPMKFRINAATDITFNGDRYLHAFVMHKFSGSSGQALNMVARARQFSSFIMMVGTIPAKDRFDPKAAIIIQNKDELKIPLILETIPTPKEFKDAIASLSPEQQRFCKAFRGMQLASTLFGVCIIQIKPQLERCLNLADDTLTKEIQLTQDLQKLFIEYQIPPDLLSFSIPGLEDYSQVPPEMSLESVKSNVAAIQDIIEKEKQAELEEAKKQAMYAELQRLKQEEQLRNTLKKKKRSKSRSRMKECESRSFSDSIQSSPASGKRAMSRKSARIERKSSQSDRKSIKVEDAEKKHDPNTEEGEGGGVSSGSSSSAGVDFTAIPNKLNASMEALDEDSALRPTIVKTSPNWHKKEKKALLANETSRNLSVNDQKTERNSAFDLLDALTRSGVLAIDQASLHIVCAATHCFDKTVLDTVLKDNINPIEKVERSVLIVASTIQDRPAAELINAAELPRVSTYSPALFPQLAVEDVPVTAQAQAIEG